MYMKGREREGLSGKNWMEFSGDWEEMRVEGNE